MLLRTFLEVYRAGSFTSAAARLGLSQPTVTAQVRALERDLGHPLFERLPRGAAPTGAAEELAARVAQPLDALAEVAASRGGADPAAGTVHLGGPAEFLTALVLPALAPLVDRGLRLRVSVGLADDLLAGLVAGRHDLVVSSVRPRVRGVAAEPLADEEFVLVASPGTAARIGADRVASEGAAALRGVPLVAYAEDLPIVRRYWRGVFGSRPAGAAAVVVPDLRGVLAAVAAGAGVSVLPRYLCAEGLARGEVVALLDPPEPPINTLHLARRAGGGHPPLLAAVGDRLREAAREW
ncbi:LysR family transcriptional regulator [Streptacidiphilus sp. ASG 303]|uniref:LysR family transcriptional regulator n=1 Tax=Streptomycetaceae TaxID=2062 RepID=UPI001E397148|nr:LysR family transcriptional regulator [Streptacidiphilus sp. ASG 303]MCD0483687.1 LysR family transcriptional regulator [Streptacidiphilus sp. ASG 303]